MKRFLPFAAIALAVMASQAGAQPVHIEIPSNIEPAASGTTSAEVVADYHIWRLAGLQDLTRGERSADTSSYQYRKAYATYLHLRQSPQFAELVEALQKNPNARVAASRSGRQSPQASN